MSDMVWNTALIQISHPYQTSLSLTNSLSIMLNSIFGSYTFLLSLSLQLSKLTILITAAIIDFLLLSTVLTYSNLNLTITCLCNNIHVTEERDVQKLISNLFQVIKLIMNRKIRSEPLFSIWIYVLFLCVR